MVCLYFHREGQKGPDEQEEQKDQEGEKNSLFVLSGIVVLPGLHTLGYYLNDTTNSSETCITMDVNRELRGMMVLIDEIGIRQIKLLYPGKQPSRWICPETPVTMAMKNTSHKFNKNKSPPSKRVKQAIEPAVGMVYYKDSPEQDVTLCAMMDETKIIAIGSIMPSGHSLSSS
ncbi:hypothetical protein VTN77DRAFT_6920 [Rasamsonia byssochlamydoides]|uniref:uncharacterized protein n=1 Tax=Rasamsonia byssochlamydoides TaxID=89139 RepID=UPI0037441A7E